MADLNKVFLMGRLTFDPELRRTPNGTAVSELRLATGRSYAGRDGERKEETLYIDITVWDRQAETCCQYLRKGSGVHVEGYLKVDSWDDKTTGEKRNKIKVVAERVQFLDRRESSGSSSEEEFSSGSHRDAGTSSSGRRSPPAPSLEPQPRSGGNGASRGSFGSPGGGGPAPGPRRPAPEPEPAGDDDEDIPF